MIYGAKTRLRYMELKDIPAFARWFNDSEVRQFLTVYLPTSVAEEERWFQEKVKDPNSKLFAIETVDGVYIGYIVLNRIHWQSRHAEMGLVIGEKDHQGKGYGSDAIRTLLRFAFEEMNLHRIYLQLRADNERGLGVYERCGFKYEGRLREALYRQGRYHDVLCLSILREEFEAAQSAGLG